MNRELMHDMEAGLLLAYVAEGLHEFLESHEAVECEQDILPRNLRDSIDRNWDGSSIMKFPRNADDASTKS